MPNLTYNTNGTGRDLYISHNNGGFSSAPQNFHHIASFHNGRLLTDKSYHRRGGSSSSSPPPPLANVSSVGGGGRHRDRWTTSSAATFQWPVTRPSSTLSASGGGGGGQTQRYVVPRAANSSFVSGLLFKYPSHQKPTRVLQDNPLITVDPQASRPPRLSAPSRRQLSNHRLRTPPKRFQQRHRSNSDVASSSSSSSSSTSRTTALPPRNIHAQNVSEHNTVFSPLQQQQHQQPQQQQQQMATSYQLAFHRPAGATTQSQQRLPTLPYGYLPSPSPPPFPYPSPYYGYQPQPLVYPPQQHPAYAPTYNYGGGGVSVDNEPSFLSE